MHPLLLHYRAASWSLNAALAALHERAQAEAEQIAAEAANAVEDGLRSSVMGVRSGGGGHGDPVSGVAISGLRAPRPNRYALLADTVTGTLTWLADQLHAPPTHDPLVRLSSLDMPPATAATVTSWIVENDQRIRERIQLAPHLWALPGAPECPACGLRSLYVHTASPSDLWTVVCRLECLCAGAGVNGGCRCGMPVRVEGVAHIWDRAAPIVATALDDTDR